MNTACTDMYDEDNSPSKTQTSAVSQHVNIREIMKNYLTVYYKSFLTEGNEFPDDYTGELTSKTIGDKVFLCSLNKNQSGLDYSKYKKGDEYTIPVETGDKIILALFDLKSVDHSKISFYNAGKQAYVIKEYEVQQDNNVSATIVDLQYKKDTIIIVADYRRLTDAGTPNQLFLTLQFTMKNHINKYLYDKVETTFKNPHVDSVGVLG